MVKPSANDRLLRGILAFLSGVFMRIAVQLATLPVLFASWSAERVGGWLLLFALPAYFSIVGQSLAGAGGNIVMAAAQEQRWGEARAGFRAAWVSATASTVLLVAALLVPALVFAEPLSARLASVGAPELTITLLWLAIYVLAIAQGMVVGVAYRVAERYPQFIFTNSLAGLAEVLVMAACILASDSYITLAAGLAVMRVLIVLVQLAHARRFLPRLFAKEAASVPAPYRELVKPTIAFVLIPMVYVLNLQGYTLLVGAFFGPVMLASFVATRTIVRLIDLLTTVVYGVQFFEAGYLGGEKVAIQRRQLASMTSLTLVLSLAFGVALVWTGGWLQAIFTAGKTQFATDVALVLLASGAIRALAVTPHAIVAAENRHGRTMAWYLGGSVTALGLASLAAVTGLPLAVVLLLLVPAELTQAVPVFRAALRQLDWTPSALWRELASRQRLADVHELWRFLRQRPDTGH